MPEAYKYGMKEPSVEEPTYEERWDNLPSRYVMHVL